MLLPERLENTCVFPDPEITLPSPGLPGRKLNDAGGCSQRQAKLWMLLKPVISTERRSNKRKDYRFGVFSNATEKKWHLIPLPPKLERTVMHIASHPSATVTHAKLRHPRHPSWKTTHIHLIANPCWFNQYSHWKLKWNQEESGWTGPRKTVSNKHFMVCYFSRYHEPDHHFIWNASVHSLCKKVHNSEFKLHDLIEIKVNFSF